MPHWFKIYFKQYWIWIWKTMFLATWKNLNGSDPLNLILDPLLDIIESNTSVPFFVLLDIEVVFTYFKLLCISQELWGHGWCRLVPMQSLHCELVAHPTALCRWERLKLCRSRNSVWRRSRRKAVRLLINIESGLTAYHKSVIRQFIAPQMIYRIFLVVTSSLSFSLIKSRFTELGES